MWRNWTKIERDLKAVKLEDRLYHETVLNKVENLLPEKVQADWSEYASENDLMTVEAAIDYNHQVLHNYHSLLDCHTYFVVA